MKNALQSSVLLLIGIFVLASCSHEKEGKSPKEIVERVKFEPEKEVEVASDIDTFEKKTVVKQWIQEQVKSLPPEPEISIGRIYEGPPSQSIRTVSPPFKINPKLEPVEEKIQIPSVDPEFPGGMKAMKLFIKETMIYPEIDRELGNQGQVYVQFVVEKDGSLSNISIIKGVTSTLDHEALRIMNLMPKWKPGKSNEKIVRCRLRMPISFIFA